MRCFIQLKIRVVANHNFLTAEVFQSDGGSDPNHAGAKHDGVFARLWLDTASGAEPNRERPNQAGFPHRDFFR